jgi:hypothetical protein
MLTLSDAMAMSGFAVAVTLVDTGIQGAVAALGAFTVGLGAGAGSRGEQRADQQET